MKLSNEVVQIELKNGTVISGTIAGALTVNYPRSPGATCSFRCMHMFQFAVCLETDRSRVPSACPTDLLILSILDGILLQCRRGYRHEYTHAEGENHAKGPEPILCGPDECSRQQHQVVPLSSPLKLLCLAARLSRTPEGAFVSGIECTALSNASATLLRLCDTGTHDGSPWVQVLHPAGHAESGHAASGSGPTEDAPKAGASRW